MELADLAARIVAEEEEAVSKLTAAAAKQGVARHVVKTVVAEERKAVAEKVGSSAATPCCVHRCTASVIHANAMARPHCPQVKEALRQPKPMVPGIGQKPRAVAALEAVATGVLGSGKAVQEALDKAKAKHAKSTGQHAPPPPPKRGGKNIRDEGGAGPSGASSGFHTGMNT